MDMDFHRHGCALTLHWISSYELDVYCMVCKRGPSYELDVYCIVCKKGPSYELDVYCTVCKKGPSLNFTLGSETSMTWPLCAGWHNSRGLLQNWLGPECYLRSAYVEILVTFAIKMPYIIFAWTKYIFLWWKHCICISEIKMHCICTCTTYCSLPAEIRLPLKLAQLDFWWVSKTNFAGWGLMIEDRRLRTEDLGFRKENRGTFGLISNG